MYLCGFSVNNFTLMALTIATGFVVDDAIVVSENTMRHIEEGMSPYEAAVIGAREVGFTVLAMSISLIAVFIPILLMGGIVGRLFREFAITLSAAILVSLVVSLTTSPDDVRAPAAARRRAQAQSLCAGARTLRRLRAAGYRASLAWSLRHGPLVMLVLLATVCLNVYLYVIIPKGFFPTQDTGPPRRRHPGGPEQLVPGDARQAAELHADRAGGSGGRERRRLHGRSQRNSGMMFIALKPLKERKESAEQVIARLRPKLAKEPGASLFLNPVQDIRIGGRRATRPISTRCRPTTSPSSRVGAQIRAAMSNLPELADVNTDTQDKGLQTSVVIDRDAASRLGVTTRMIDTTLNDLFRPAAGVDHLRKAQPVSCR
jgi:multidrug efflux pump